MQLTVANTGSRDLQGYQVRLDWRNGEVISDVTNWDLGDQYLPRPGNMTVFISPAARPFLFTAVEAVGNASIYSSSGTIAGTQRGAATPAQALPGGIILQAAGYNCPDDNISFPSGKAPFSWSAESLMSPVAEVSELLGRRSVRQGPLRLLL